MYGIYAVLFVWKSVEIMEPGRMWNVKLQMEEELEGRCEGVGKNTGECVFFNDEVYELNE